MVFELLSNQKSLLSKSHATEHNLSSYLAGEDDDLLDDPSSLVLQELLDDVASDVTSPNDSKVCVSRHELRLVGIHCVVLALFISTF